MKLLLCLFLSAISITASAKGHKKGAKPKAGKAYPSKVHLTKVGTCTVPADPAGKEPTKMVYVLKQWHLAPTTVTKGFKEKYPQEKNQTAIYHVLEEGVKRGELQLIVSEGCEGEINSEFKTTFNGWDYDSLKAQAFQKNYDKIITLAPLKIEAKYGDKVATFCGDDEKEIREGLLHLSNLRGWAGFYTRLSETKGTDKAQGWVEKAAEVLKMPKDTPMDKLITAIKANLKDDLGAFRKTLQTRNDSILKTLQTHEFTKAAVVIGGLHASDLREKLEKAGMNCEIDEPPGYLPDDERLIQDFEKAMN